MRKLFLSFLIFTFYFPMLSCAASFDCTKAASVTEKLICSDESISKLDEQLATSYKAALEKATDKDVFKKAQVEWLKQQRECEDAACLTRSYQTRISELNTSLNVVTQSSANPSSATTLKPTDGFKKPLTFKLAFGDSYPVCQPYVNMLNEAKYESSPVCERKILPEFSQFKEAQWTEIMDKEKMVKTIENNIQMYYAFLNKLDSQQQKNEIRDVLVMVEHEEVKLYSTEFDLDADGKNETIYKMVFVHGVKNGLGEENNTCNIKNFFYIEDQKITLERASTELFFKNPSAFMNFGSHNDLFYFDNKKIFSSQWNIYKAKGGNHNIDLYTTQNSLICGINIIQ